MNDDPPVMKPEHSRLPSQLAPNAPDDEDNLLENVANVISKPFFIIGAVAVAAYGGVRYVYSKWGAPPRPHPPRPYAPRPPEPEITILTDESLDIDTPGKSPDVNLPDDLVTMLPADPALNEQGPGDARQVERRPSNLVEAIELLPDAPRPVESPLAVAYGSSPVLHAYRRTALANAQRHASEYKRQEVGGILLGVIRKNDKGQYLAVVTGIIRADTAIGREASLRFAPDTWVDTLAIRDRHPIYGDEDTWQVVGWYHTHPGFGIFLSSLDVHTHGAFLHPGHIALVIDPSTRDYGTFGWNRDQTQPVRLAEESRTAQWKTLLDEAQTLKLLNKLKLPLNELPPAELTTTDGATTGVAASSRPDAPAKDTPIGHDKGDRNMV
jgi:proteasome lid subunit RPN8/RPN11